MAEVADTAAASATAAVIPTGEDAAQYAVRPLSEEELGQVEEEAAT
ncbi:MAG: hypothetical protein MEP57_08660 [Microvirga sp.]|nr:hypothetical protein [Microvirga sp.]